MDENRVAGSIKEVKGASKEATGDALGDAAWRVTARPTRSSARVRIMLAA